MHALQPTAGLQAPRCPPLSPPPGRSNWAEVMATNVEGSYNAARACFPYMQKAGHGKIVFISSIAGTRGESLCPRVPRRCPGGRRLAEGARRPARPRPAGAGTQVAYACSKGGVLALAKSLAAAWGRHNIQVRWERAGSEAPR